VRETERERGGSRPKDDHESPSDSSEDKEPHPLREDHSNGSASKAPVPAIDHNVRPDDDRDSGDDVGDDRGPDDATRLQHPPEDLEHERGPEAVDNVSCPDTGQVSCFFVNEEKHTEDRVRPNPDEGDRDGEESEDDNGALSVKAHEGVEPGPIRLCQQGLQTSKRERDRKRQRERETERDRETERETDRETKRERQREGD
jgi:hypothetical protein